MTAHDLADLADVRRAVGGEHVGDIPEVARAEQTRADYGEEAGVSALPRWADAADRRRPARSFSPGKGVMVARCAATFRCPSLPTSSSYRSWPCSPPIAGTEACCFRRSGTSGGRADSTSSAGRTTSRCDTCGGIPVPRLPSTTTSRRIAGSKSARPRSSLTRAGPTSRGRWQSAIWAGRGRGIRRRGRVGRLGAGPARARRSAHLGLRRRDVRPAHRSR